MTFSVEVQHGYSVVLLTGDIDLSHSSNARKVILNCLKKMKHVMVDLSAVDYIDSSGVASLVEGLQLARSKGLEYALVGVSDPAMSVLRLARLDQVFEIVDSVEDYQSIAG